MEQRLIDANAIFDKVEAIYRMSEGVQHECEREFLNLICDAQTMDAVQVVRCGECKKWNSYKDGIKGLCGHFDHVMPTREYFYCADGERRTDEQQ